MSEKWEPSQALRRADELLAAQLRAALRSAPRATIEEWWLLSLLSDGTGHAMSDVAAYTGLPAPSLTRLVDRLVSDNTVYRRADDADRRRVLAYLTERGRARHDELASIVAAYTRRLLDAGADLAGLASSLDKTAAALAALDDDEPGPGGADGVTGAGDAGPAFFTSP